MRTKEVDEWKTAFNCSLGCYQFQVMPFRLQGVPATFMQLINEDLHECLYMHPRAANVLGHILIYIETPEEYKKLVKAVL